MFITKLQKSTREGVRRRAALSNTSLARTKFAISSHYIPPSPYLAHNKHLKDAIPEDSMEVDQNITAIKAGHREMAIKDHLLSKPNRWHYHWAKFMHNKEVIEKAAGFSDKIIRAEQVNWDWQIETNCFLNRLNLKPNILTVDEIHQIVGNAECHSKEATVGREFLTSYLKMIIQNAYPKLPDSGKDAILETILDPKYIRYQLQHTGLLDFQLEPETLGKIENILNKFIYKILTKDCVESAAKLIQILLVSGLVQRDIIRDLWKLEPENALFLFESEMKELNVELEPRIINKSAGSEIMQVFQVGFYDKNTKEFLIDGFGESVNHGMWDAAILGLNELYDIKDGVGKLSESFV